MTEREILSLFQESGALLSGHFLLSSGNHSDSYLEKFRIFERPELHSNLITELLAKFQSRKIECVLGPALGGVIMAAEAGRQLKVRAVYAEKENGKLVLRRGFKLYKGEKVLIVDDIITTGGSIKESIEIAKSAGVEIVGIGALADRSGSAVDFGIEHIALLNLKLPIFPPEDCPLCLQKEPLVKPGSRNL
jgi:orotate phosphoribosyltransferase